MSDIRHIPNGYAPSITDVAAFLEWVGQRVDEEFSVGGGEKAGPGSRGGSFYYDARGRVRYGTPPSGAKKGKARRVAKTPEQRAAEAAIREKARAQALAMRQAKSNAAAEVRDITTIAGAKALGWEDAGDGGSYKDSAAANDWARQQGKEHPDQIIAVVKTEEGYTVIAKPMASLSGDRSNVMGRNAGADTAAAQRTAQAAAKRTERQAAQEARKVEAEAKRAERTQKTAQARAERDAARAARQAERDAARQGRAAARAAARPSGATTRATTGRGAKEAEGYKAGSAEERRAALERALEADLETELRDAYRAFAHDHDYDFSEHEAEVETLLREYYPEAFDLAYQEAQSAHGLDVVFDAHNPKVEGVINEMVGDRVKGIAETTKATLKDLVFTGTEAGLSPAGLAKLIVEQGITDSKWRANTIARTETATAYNVGAVRSYNDAGVEKVRVLDGDYDSECSAAHGQVWTLEEAQAHPIQHPNCVRAFAPIIGGA